MPSTAVSVEASRETAPSTLPETFAVAFVASSEATVPASVAEAPFVSVTAPAVPAASCVKFEASTETAPSVPAVCVSSEPFASVVLPSTVPEEEICALSSFRLVSTVPETFAEAFVA